MPSFPDLLAALLLPIPPWIGFWLFRAKGRIGLSYGYFLGGLLTVLAFPWAQVAGAPVATPPLGSTLLGFALFLQGQREGVHGPRRLILGVGGSTALLALLLAHLGHPWRAVARFWAVGLVEALAWALLADVAYRLSRGRQLELRMPLVGLAATALGALARSLPGWGGAGQWPTSLLAGLLLGAVAAHQLRWLREQGAWVEGRGAALRLALGVLERNVEPEGPSMALGLDAQQPMALVDAQGKLLEANGPLAQMTGLPRHRLRGYDLEALFQGGEAPVWDGLRQQLLRAGGAGVPATQVSADGSFRPVRLEATPFDRGMALVWVSQDRPGSLLLRGGGLMDPDTRGDASLRARANALLCLHAGLSDPAPDASRRENLLEAVARLDHAPSPTTQACLLDASETMTALLPGLQHLAPGAPPLKLAAVALPLEVEPERLDRILRHLLLHALEREPAAELILRLEPATLGQRTFGLLQVVATGPQPRPSRALFGLAWLRQVVLEAGGLLELDQDPQTGLQPRVYLPAATTHIPLQRASLEGARVWIVDQDPLVRSALTGLVATAGGTTLAVPDLRTLLRASRDEPGAQALVVERSPQLERFHRAFKGPRKTDLPTLVLGLGDPLPPNPGATGFRRLGFLDKPFRPAAFLEALLALLHEPGRPVGPLL